MTPPSSLVFFSLHGRMASLVSHCAQLSRPPTHMADTFHPPYPPIASQSISPDVPLARARAFQFSPLCPKGSSQTVLRGRALREHRRSSGPIPSSAPGAQDQRGCPSNLFIVGTLQARRAPGRSPHLPSLFVSLSEGSSPRSRGTSECGNTRPEPGWLTSFGSWNFQLHGVVKPTRCIVLIAFPGCTSYMIGS